MNVPEKAETSAEKQEKVRPNIKPIGSVKFKDKEGRDIAIIPIESGMINVVIKKFPGETNKIAIYAEYAADTQNS